MKKHTLFLALILLVWIIFALLAIRAFSGNEDTWFCQNGEWIKHGNPDLPMPEVRCNKNAKDLSDGPNSIVITNGMYDKYLDREVPTSTILRFGDDVLQIYTPLSGMYIKSPQRVYGLAPSTWFFEGGFPIKLVDDKGNVLAQTQAKAQGEWTKPGLVHFNVNLDFSVSQNIKTGRIIFSNDNPSGMPDKAKSVGMGVKLSLD